MMCHRRVSGLLSLIITFSAYFLGLAFNPVIFRSSRIAWRTVHNIQTQLSSSSWMVHHATRKNQAEKESGTTPTNNLERWVQQSAHAVAAVTLGLVLSISLPTTNNMAFAADDLASVATTTTTTTAISSKKSYDGFADYAKENQMQQSDVGCFINKCGDQTKALFSNPRGIKGVSCLGRCKGEQSCATRCFAEFGSDDLNNWLSCTIEENECVKVPKNIDNLAENVGYSMALRNFDPKSLQGVWYKTDGLNPNYDLFDCQTNRFTPKTASGPTTTTTTTNSEVDMDIFFRVSRPTGGFWENALTEHMVVDEKNDDTNPSHRTMHTSGKMYGLKFEENWYILGESDGSGDIPAFKLVAYKGHTLQGNYEGAFVYAKVPILPEAAVPAVREAASRAGLDFDKFTRIDNTCPPGEPLNNDAAGTGTSTTDWLELVVGEGGVIDWISPGWRGEYSKRS